MTSYEQPYIEEVTPPVMRELLVLRERVFFEEMVASDIPAMNVAEHLKGWDKEFTDTTINEWTSWLDEPEAWYMRRVVRGSDSVGLFIATPSSPQVNGAKYISVLQLDKSVRGYGLGRSLVKGFVEFGDPSQPVYLHAIATNESALGFYGHIGFEDTGERGMMSIGGYEAETNLLVKGTSHEV